LAARRIAGRGPPRELRVPPAGAVAKVIREKGPTRVQSRCRRPPYPVPSNGPPSAPAKDTAPRSKRKKAPSSTDAVRHSGIGPPPQKKRRGVPHAESPAAWRGGRLLPQPRHLPSGLTTNANDIGHFGKQMGKTWIELPTFWLEDDRSTTQPQLPDGVCPQN
ncbi:unnamed protein product, partial [Pleuronectes platessa]